MKKIAPKSRYTYSTANACLKIVRLLASKYNQRKLAEKFNILVTQDDDPHRIRRAILRYELAYRLPNGGTIAYGFTSSGSNLLRGIRGCISFTPEGQTVQKGLSHLLSVMLVDIDGCLYQPAGVHSESTKITGTRTWDKVRSQRGGWRRACISKGKRIVNVDMAEFEFEQLFPRSHGISKARILLLARCIRERMHQT